MTTDHASAPHVSPIRVYVMIWLALLVGTALTVVVAYQNLGVFNNLMALGIAFTKASLVILYFMHAKYSTKLTKTTIVCAFIWLFILIAFTLMDFDSRGWMGVPGK
jgi:cytochrome c oxidase subunit 4